MTTSSNVKQNVIANFAGRGWSGAIGFLFVPIYIRFLGIEAYGLIGIYVSLSAILMILDMGLSTTLNRELARLFVTEGQQQKARDLVRTLEVIYWGTGVALGAILIALAPFFVHHWINPQGLPAKTVERVFMLMALVVALRWPVSLYTGGLMGLQKQVKLNIVCAGISTLQAGGVTMVLWLISPSIQAFFIWQAFIGALFSLLLGYSLWSELPVTGQRATFSKRLLVDIWRFAAGMTGITILATILTQLDKIILCKVLPLKTFGYYTLASTIASMLSYATGPIFAGVFPKLSHLVAEDKEDDLTIMYHKGCQLLSIIIVPVSIMVAFNSKVLLSFYLGDKLIVDNVYILLILLITGNAINSLMVMPLALQLAYGWTKLSFYKEVIAVVLFVPLLVWMITHFGAIGAGISWIILTASFFLIEVPIMHRRLLRNEMWRWYSQDIGVPIIIGLAIGLLFSIFIPRSGSSWEIIPWILLLFLSAFFFSALALRYSRQWLKMVYNIISF